MRYFCYYTVLFYIFSLLLQNAICLVDPISLTVGAGALIGAYTGFGYFSNKYCDLNECCSEKSIPANIQGLRDRLSKNLYGQHIVIEQVIAALQAHLSSQVQSRKPLVMSFHGTPGTGKNYVADMMAESLYAKGIKSRFVHRFNGRLDFSVSENTNSYNERIAKQVQDAVADCPRSLFIFDEVEKMPGGVFESLTALVDYNGLNSLDSGKAIFIFLSNIAGIQIANQLAKMLKNGEIREHSKLSDFEHILEKTSYNVDGGFQKASLVDRYVIDHYIPFLPLEKTHVLKCIAAEFTKWKHSPSADEMDALLKAVITYDKTHNLFATSGCKTIEKKVAIKVAIKV